MNRTLANDALDAWAADGSDLWEDSQSESLYQSSAGLEWSDTDSRISTSSALIIAFPEPLHVADKQADYSKTTSQRLLLSSAGVLLAVISVIHFAFSAHVIYVIPSFAAAFYFFLDVVGSWAEKRDLAEHLSSRADTRDRTSAPLAKVA